MRIDAAIADQVVRVRMPAFPPRPRRSGTLMLHASKPRPMARRCVEPSESEIARVDLELAKDARHEGDPRYRAYLWISETTGSWAWRNP